MLLLLPGAGRGGAGVGELGEARRWEVWESLNDRALVRQRHGTMNHVVINEQVPRTGALFDATTRSLSGLQTLFTHTLVPMEIAKVAAEEVSGDKDEGGRQVEWRRDAANEGVQEPSWLRRGEERRGGAANDSLGPSRPLRGRGGEGRGWREPAQVVHSSHVASGRKREELPCRWSGEREKSPSAVAKVAQ